METDHTGPGSPALLAGGKDGESALGPEAVLATEAERRTFPSKPRGFDDPVPDLLRRLPDIAVVRDRCRAMAVLDAILCPDWGGRYYSFDAHWGNGEQMASMRDGSGNDWFMIFSPAGAYARGYDHNVPNTPGLLAAVPDVFRSSVQEPAFADQDGRPLATI